MTYDDRQRELNVLRQKNPKRLIAIYRSATNTPEQVQLPRGLGFTGMIEAILEHEVTARESNEESQQAVEVANATPNCPVTVAQRGAHMVELRAVCGGGTIVIAGLLLAVLYLFLNSV